MKRLICPFPGSVSPGRVPKQQEPPKKRRRIASRSPAFCCLQRGTVITARPAFVAVVVFCGLSPANAIMVKPQKEGCLQRYRREKSSACLTLPSLPRKGTPPLAALLRNNEHRKLSGFPAASVLEEKYAQTFFSASTLTSTSAPCATHETRHPASGKPQVCALFDRLPVRCFVGSMPRCRA